MSCCRYFNFEHWEVFKVSYFQGTKPDFTLKCSGLRVKSYYYILLYIYVVVSIYYYIIINLVHNLLRHNGNSVVVLSTALMVRH